MKNLLEEAPLADVFTSPPGRSADRLEDARLAVLLLPSRQDTR